MGYAPPRPDEPSITMGVSLGLFDVTLDGFPELFVDLGGGSAGNAYYYVYDIITGEMLGDVHGGVATSPAIYLNLKTGEYEVIERYTYRGGATAISESIGMLIFDDETNNIREKNLFCSFYVYDWIFLTDENGNFEGSDLEISEVGFFVDDESSDHEDYHYFLNYFESTHSLIPNTSMRRVSSYDFREYSDSPQIKAEKIANALVYESEQKFVKMDK